MKEFINERSLFFHGYGAVKLLPGVVVYPMDKWDGRVNVVET